RPHAVRQLQKAIVSSTVITAIAHSGAHMISVHVVLLDATIRIGRRLVGARRHETTRALAAGQKKPPDGEQTQQHPRRGASMGQGTGRHSTDTTTPHPRYGTRVAVEVC